MQPNAWATKKNYSRKQQLVWSVLSNTLLCTRYRRKIKMLIFVIR